MRINNTEVQLEVTSHQRNLTCDSASLLFVAASENTINLELLLYRPTLTPNRDALEELLVWCLHIPTSENTFQKDAIQMLVGEVMTRNVEVIGSNAPLVETAAKMKNLDVGLIPVCEADELKGTPTDRDITVRGIAEGYNPSETKVGDIMSTDLAYCFEDEEIEEARSGRN